MSNTVQDSLYLGWDRDVVNFVHCGPFCGRNGHILGWERGTAAARPSGILVAHEIGRRRGSDVRPLWDIEPQVGYSTAGTLTLQYPQPLKRSTAKRVRFVYEGPWGTQPLTLSILDVHDVHSRMCISIAAYLHHMWTSWRGYGSRCWLIDGRQNTYFAWGKTLHIGQTAMA